MTIHSENTLLFNDLSLLGAIIHVHARRNFTTDQLAALGKIRGVTSYTAEGKLYMTTIRVEPRGPDNYTSFISSIRKGKLFTFEELAPQIALVFADVMGVEVEDLDIITQKSGKGECRADWINDAARKLRPKAASRNPNAPEFAMTKNDITNGVPIIVAIRNSKGLPACLYEDTLHGQIAARSDECYRTSKYPDGCYIANFGITEWHHLVNGWKRSFAIVNNAENRKALLAWCLSHNENKLAQELVEKYPDLAE